MIHTVLKREYSKGFLRFWVKPTQDKFKLYLRYRWRYLEQSRQGMTRQEIEPHWQSGCNSLAVCWRRGARRTANALYLQKMWFCKFRKQRTSYGSSRGYTEQMQNQTWCTNHFEFDTRKVRVLHRLNNMIWFLHIYSFWAVGNLDI